MLGFVIPTKSFVKIGITKIFCYNNKMLSSINKTFGCCSQTFGCSNKKFICLSLILLPKQNLFFPCTFLRMTCFAFHVSPKFNLQLLLRALVIQNRVGLVTCIRPNLDGSAATDINNQHQETANLG